MGHHNGLMPSAPDADENSTDQPGTQPGTATSSDKTPSLPDTGEAEGKSEGVPFPPRGTLTLRALRWGGLIDAVVLGVTALVLRRELKEAGSLIPDEAFTMTGLMIFGGVLVWLFLSFRKKKRPILVTIMITVMAALGMATAASLTLAWWNTYQETGFSVLFLLVLAGVALSATLFLSVGPLLHYLRMRTTAVGIGDPDDPSRWRRLQRKTGEKTDKGLPRYESIRVPRRTRTYLMAMVIAPVLMLGSALAGTWALVNPVHHVMATPPADTSLAPPTSLAPTATWSTEISSTELTTVAGAGGPIFLTDDGVMALSPKGGSVLWSYSRKHTTVAPNSYSDSRRLITSPDGKYVATRIQLPAFVASPQGSEAAITLVFDALTGRIVFERQSTNGNLQLTDSAVLDGDTAFSLTDRSQMWTLPENSDVSYSGPAGHASFILKSSEEPPSEDAPTSVYRSTVTTTVFPQNNPTAEVEVQNILSELPSEPNAFDNPFSSFINGWAARYTGEADSSGNPVAEVISLDALAKVDGADTKTFPLGATSGINTEASRVSGSIVTYPIINREVNIHDHPEKSRSEAVFDPVTRTVTPASQYPGLAGARTGIDTTIREGKQSRALVIRPGDGSAGLTIPIEPGSVSFPVEEKEPASSEPEKKTIFLNAPGVTLVALDPENGIEHQNSKDGDYIHTHTHRLYGVAGGSA